MSLENRIFSYIQDNANKVTDDEIYLLGLDLNCDETEINNALNSLLQDKKILSVWFNERGLPYKEKTWEHTQHGYTIRASNISDFLLKQLCN